MDLRSVFLSPMPIRRITLAPSYEPNSKESAAPFASIAALAREVSELDIPENPYLGKFKACERHLSAIFRSDPRARLSLELYSTLRIVLERNVERQTSLEGKSEAAGRLYEFERLAQAFVRKYERPLSHRPSNDFMTEMTQARQVYLFWNTASSLLTPVLRPIFSRLRMNEVKVEAVGRGIWEALHRLAMEEQVDWMEAYELLQSWSKLGIVKVSATTDTSIPAGEFSFLVVDLDDLNLCGYMILFENRDQLVSIPLPTDSTRSLTMRRFGPRLAPVDPSTEVAIGKYITPKVNVLIQLPHQPRTEKE